MTNDKIPKKGQRWKRDKEIITIVDDYKTGFSYTWVCSGWKLFNKNKVYHSKSKQIPSSWNLIVEIEGFEL